MSYIRYLNQNATRSQPLSPELEQALGFLPELGVTAEVFSGGQAAKGSGGPRTGSTRHDHGNAADVFFVRDGRRLDWANPDERPVFEEIVRRGKANGISGVGAGDGYMQPGSMHIGFGNPGVWGAGGREANAPDWLRQAYGEAPVRDNPAREMPVQDGGGQEVAYGGGGSDDLTENPMPERVGGLGGLGGFLRSEGFGDALSAFGTSLMTSPSDNPFQNFGEALDRRQDQRFRKEALEEKKAERAADRQAMETVLRSYGMTAEEARAYSGNPSAANLAISKRKEALETDRGNMTADSLEAKHPDLAAAIRTGAITGMDGAKEAWRRDKEGSEAPSGYRRSADGRALEFIPGGPADPAMVGRLKPMGGFENEQGLRKEYTSTPEFKEYADVRSSYERLRASADTQSGPGDLGVIFGYMKMLDPGSVVREGEFATAENATGVPDRISNLYNRIVSGERLTPEQRNEFVTAAGNLYGQVATKAGALNDRYSAIAGQYGIDPTRIIQPLPTYEPLDLGQASAATATGTSASNTPAAPAGIPVGATATNQQTGKKIRWSGTAWENVQ